MKPADNRAVQAWRNYRPDFFGTPLADLRAVKTIRGLAKNLGLTQAAVSKWRQVPDRHVVAVARFLDVPEAQLRPDLYPPAPWSEL